MENIENKKSAKLPIYIKAIYGWLYCSWNVSQFFDRTIILKFLTLGFYTRIQDSYLKEIGQSQKVLQLGATFGNQIENTADKIGHYGKYDLVDVSEMQLRRAEEKYKYLFSNMTFINQDATTPFTDKYDIVVCYNLLHELPPSTRVKVVNNALESLNDKGKVVFVDYYSPVIWHPLRYFVRMFNRLFQPFAEKMWDKEIHTLADNRIQYSWKKTTFFGGMYQKVIATKKDNLSKQGRYFFNDESRGV